MFLRLVFKSADGESIGSDAAALSCLLEQIMAMELVEDNDAKATAATKKTLDSLVDSVFSILSTYLQQTYDDIPVKYIEKFISSLKKYPATAAITNQLLLTDIKAIQETPEYKQKPRLQIFLELDAEARDLLNVLSADQSGDSHEDLTGQHALLYNQLYLEHDTLFTQLINIIDVDDAINFMDFMLLFKKVRCMIDDLDGKKEQIAASVRGLLAKILKNYSNKCSELEEVTYYNSHLITEVYTNDEYENIYDFNFGNTAAANNEIMPGIFVLDCDDDYDSSLNQSSSSITAKEKPMQVTESQHNMGPRLIAGWVLHDVAAAGNCFYDAIITQMRLIKHQFLTSVPHGTEPRDSLRLRVQGSGFQDATWADDDTIEKFLIEFPDVILAIADTRYPTAGFVVRYRDPQRGSMLYADYDAAVQTVLNDPNRSIIRIAATGNHFLSVTAHPALDTGVLQTAFNQSNSSQSSQTIGQNLSNLNISNGACKANKPLLPTFDLHKVVQPALEQLRKEVLVQLLQSFMKPKPS